MKTETETKAAETLEIDYETEKKYKQNPIGCISTETAKTVLNVGFKGRIWEQYGKRRVYLQRLNNSNRNAGYVDLNDGSVHWTHGEIKTLVAFVIKCEESA